MSVATEFAPSVSIPARARLAGPAPRPALAPAAEPAAEPAALVAPRPAARPSGPAPALAPVVLLRPPADRVPARLTRRGVAVLSVAVVGLALVLVWVARLSAPSAGRPTPAAPHRVTVQAGDTLWAIADRVAPGADPQAEVDRLRRLNHLASVDLVPGQQLRVP